jgi:hypothetical protein
MTKFKVLSAALVTVALLTTPATAPASHVTSRHLPRREASQSSPIAIWRPHIIVNGSRVVAVPIQTSPP